MNTNIPEEYLISLIIPIYNLAKYIGECLDSLSAGLNKHMEIVCIDDGSTDASRKIIESYKNNYPNIKYYFQPNSGAGIARNKGMDCSKGKYISFLDADDYYCSIDTLIKMAEICESQNIDICGSASWYLCNNTRKNQEQRIDCVNLNDLPQEGKRCFLEEWQNDYGYTNFVFRKAFIEENSIRFPGYRRYEDPVFLLQALLKSSGFWVIPSPLYCCRIGYKDSSHVDNTIVDILKGIRDNIKIALEYKYSKLQQRLINRLSNDYYNAIIHNLTDDVMSLLLEINRINHEFDKPLELSVLNDIYSGMDKEKNIRREIEKKLVSDQRLYDDLQCVLNDFSSISEYLRKNHVNKIGIYGLGVYGILLLDEMILDGISIECCIDRQKSGQVREIEILKPSDKLPDIDLLIVALRNADPVVSDYRNMHVLKVIGIMELAESIISGTSLPDYFRRNNT